MRPTHEGERVLRIEPFGVAFTSAITLAVGGVALGFAAYNGTYDALSIEHSAQLQRSENAADTVLGQYDNVTSSLPEACRLVVKDAMKGSLDNPLEIITAANKSGTCQGNMDEITTVTYQYHDKMLQAEKDITAANNSLEADSITAGWVGGPVGVIGALGGWSLGFGLMMGIPLGRRKVKGEVAQPSITQNETNIPELTTGESQEQSAVSAQKPEEANMYIVGHEDYAYQNDMR